MVTGALVQEEYEKLQKLSEDQAKQIESLRTELKKVVVMTTDSVLDLHFDSSQADNFYLSRAKFDARLRGCDFTICEHMRC